MQGFGQLQESSEFRLIGGVAAVIVASFLFGYAILAGAEVRGRLTQVVQLPANVEPAERLAYERARAELRPIDPAWRRAGILFHVARADAAPAAGPGQGRTPRGRPGRVLRGRVRFPAGTPPDERAFVVASTRRPSGRAAADAPRAEVAPDGTFELADPPDEHRVWLSLEARYLRLEGGRRVGLSDADDDAVLLVPSLGAYVTGTLEHVEDARATVELASSATGPAFARIAVEDGRFELGGLAPGRSLWLRTVAPDAATDPPQAMLFEPGEHRRLALGLVPHAHVEGLAVDAAGDPLADAVVRARPARLAGRRADAIATTDAMGRFELAALEPGDWHVFLDEAAEVHRVPVRLVAGARERGVRLHAPPTASLRARITWQDGAPAADATVVLEGDGRDGAVEARLDADGSLALDDLAPGAWTLRVRGTRSPKNGVLEVGSLERPIVLPTDAWPELELEGRGRLEGEVVDAEGRAVERFSLVAVGEDGARVEAEVEGGRFRIDGLPSGRWEVSVRGDQGLARRVTVPLARGETRRLRLGTPVRATTSSGATRVVLEGRLRLGHEPVAGEVWVEHGGGPVVRVATDPFGRFVVEDVAAGAANVRVLLEGFGEPIERSLVIPRRERHEVELRFATGALEGRVVGADERALAGLAVEARRVGARSTVSRASSATTTTDAAGRFFLPFLEAGSWRVTIDGASHGLARTTWDPVEVDLGAHVATYRLAPGAELVGRVEDAQGQPVAGAQLFATLGPDAATRFPLGISTGADGTWRAEAAQLGTWSVLARTPDGRTSTPTSVVLAAGETRVVPKLVVAPGSAVRVLVTDAEGAQVESWVEVFDQDGGRHEDAATLGEDGALRFGPLPGGVYWVRATDVDGRSAEGTVEVAGHDRDLTLKLD